MEQLLKEATLGLLNARERLALYRRTNHPLVTIAEREFCKALDRVGELQVMVGGVFA